MRHEVFSDALNEAKIQLSAVEEKFRDLTAERSRLQAVVAGLENYLLGVPPSESDASGPIRLTSQEPRMAAWISARDVLAERGAPATVPLIWSALQAKSIYIAKDALRVAMIRKPDVFVQLGNGAYGLTAYGATMQLEEKEATQVAS